MSEEKHIDGPWEWHHARMDSVSHEWSLQTPTHAFLLFDFLPSIDHQERLAIANLMAAAPNLLAALIAITDQLERIGDLRPHKDGGFIDDAREAISIATGTIKI